MQRFLTAMVAVFTGVCGQPAHAAGPADAIYQNGTILTMVDAQPVAEAVAVRDGRILAVGTKAELLETVGDATRKIDLGGKTLLPGFVDSHGHAYLIG